jgi:Uma2 family endonuclease
MEAAEDRMTADEYHYISVEGDRKQLVDGTIIVNEPKPIHARLQLRLVMALQRWIDAGDRRGFVSLPTDVQLDDFNVYGPDLIWFREEHKPVDLNEYFEHLPDICVEIRSPHNWRFDVGPKRRAYEANGLPELWLVHDAHETVQIHRRMEPDSPTFDVAPQLAKGDVLTSPQLPGFARELDELFAGA